MNNLQDLLNKLDKMNLTIIDGNNLLSVDGWAVSYRLELHSSNNPVDLPIQPVIHIRKDDVYCQTWGCVGSDEVELFINWVVSKRYEIKDRNYDNDNIIESSNKQLFEQL